VEPNCPGSAKHANGIALAALSRMEATKLSEPEIAAVLAKLPSWRAQDGKLHREYKFNNFLSAFSFLSSSAFVIHEMNHHPEWFNLDTLVRIDLNTHDLGGISSLDAKLAYAMEELAARQLGR
jgi:4a-hydroxytetrahydrobiopterin dehydratase